MEEIRCQKIRKYKENLSTKLLFLQNNENSLTTLLHSAEELSFKHIVNSNFRPLQEWLYAPVKADVAVRKRHKRINDSMKS